MCPPCIFCWPIWVVLVVLYGGVCILAYFGVQWAVGCRNKLHGKIGEYWKKIRKKECDSSHLT